MSDAAGRAGTPRDGAQHVRKSECKSESKVNGGDICVVGWGEGKVIVPRQSLAARLNSGSVSQWSVSQCSQSVPLLVHSHGRCHVRREPASLWQL